MTSIFDTDNKLTRDFWKYPNIGDKVSGTFIRKSSQTNRINGQEQILYEIKTPEGKIVTIGGKRGIDMQMQNVKLGQIVGFEYVEERPSKEGLNPAKIVQVYANTTIVDEQWIKDNEEAQSGPGFDFPNDEEKSTPKAINKTTEKTTTPDPDQPFYTQSEKDELIKKITELSVSRLGANDASDAKIKIMETTGIAFIDINLQKIVSALEAIPPRK